ncbi:MAG: transposase [Candidatus Methanomethylicaceae archaeon]
MDRKGKGKTLYCYKANMVEDAAGKLVMAVKTTPGNAHNGTQWPELVDGRSAEVAADKASDSAAINPHLVRPVCGLRHHQAQTPIKEVKRRGLFSSQVRWLFPNPGVCGEGDEVADIRRLCSIRLNCRPKENRHRPGRGSESEDRPD